MYSEERTCVLRLSIEEKVILFRYMVANNQHPPEVEKDLIVENQRLRPENDYLKKLHALILEREIRERKRGQSRS